jgi:hypothetical protein
MTRAQKLQYENKEKIKELQIKKENIRSPLTNLYKCVSSKIRDTKKEKLDVQKYLNDFIPKEEIEHP